jgi:hypothetical protein
MARTEVGMPRTAKRWAVLAIAATMVVPAAADAAPKNGGSSCNGRKSTCPAADTAAPVVGWTAPTDGASTPGSFTASGTASDTGGIARVEVRVDGGAFALAAGTTSWSAPVDGLQPGSHTLVARATDSAGNAASATVDVTVPAPDEAPTVAITSPADSSTVSGVVDLAGTASDDVGLVAVEIQVDGGAFVSASGTTAWSHRWDSAAYAAGDHMITARATDSAGNVSSSSITVTVAADGAGTAIQDPNARYDLYPLVRTRLPTWGSLTGVLYTELVTNRRAVWFRDAATGTSTYVDLPSDALTGWSAAAAQMVSATELWVFGGQGPMTLRRYQLSGSPVPTSATLLESRSFGDTDSRPGDLVVLASGGIVAAWHQQGATGPEGQHVAYRSPAGEWSALPALTFMSTRSSDQVLAQHPADGSVWLFSNPDAWGAVGAARLVEAGGTLAVDWTDGLFIYSSRVGVYGSDPENPNLAAAADPGTGTIALAYQSADRKYFSDGSRTVVGSRIAVARVRSDRSLAFVLGYEYAERVSDVGLLVAGGDTWITYRPLDGATLTWDAVHAARERGGTWDAPVDLGMGTGDPVGYGTGRAEVSTRMVDGRIHLFSL